MMIVQQPVTLFQPEGFEQLNMAEEVKLIGMWASPFVRRVELALKLKGVEFEYIEEDLSNKSSLLLESNPMHKKVPVLIHNGKPIVESLIILEYIEETWENYPLLPQDPYDRAMARFWADFIDDKLYSSLRKLKMSGEDAEKVTATEEIHDIITTLERELKGDDFFGGDKIGFLDIAATLIAFWMTTSEEAINVGLLPREKFPVLYKWIDKVVEDPIANQCRPPKDKLIAHMKARSSHK